MRWYERLELDGFDLALRLSLLLLLLKPIGEPHLRPWTLTLATAGLLLPGLARRPALWAALSGLAAWRVLADWPLADNHAYLLTYWYLAGAISLALPESRAALALNGRLLIGLSFGFAAIWKEILSPDYLDGTFFRVTLLTDPRLEGFTLATSGISAQALAEAREVLWQHLDGAAVAGEAIGRLSTRFEWLATLATLWTLLLESVVAAAFLLPGWRALRALRDPALWLFCATTYVLLPSIAGFGWLLLAMGIAQCDSERRRMPLGYLAVFALLLLSRELRVGHLWLG